MGFWNSLWHTIKQIGTLGYDIFKPVVMTLKDVVGAAGGGPIAAAMAGVTSGIKNIHTGIDRFKEDWDDITGPNNGTGTGLSNDVRAVLGSVNSDAGMGMMTDALKNVSASAPDSVKHLAVAGAKFHDAFDRYHDIDAAIKAAGATPITGHMSHAMSGTVVDHIRSMTGFDARMATLRHPVFGQTAMLPSTSAMYPSMMDSLSASIPERIALKSLQRGVVSGSG